VPRRGRGREGSAASRRADRPSDRCSRAILDRTTGRKPLLRSEAPWRWLGVAGARRPGRACRRSYRVAIPCLHVRRSRPGQRAPATPSPGQRDRVRWLGIAAGSDRPVTLSKDRARIARLHQAAGRRTFGLVSAATCAGGQRGGDGGTEKEGGGDGVRIGLRIDVAGPSWPGRRDESPFGAARCRLGACAVARGASGGEQVSTP
jgi:hypothetical protein